MGHCTRTAPLTWLLGLLWLAAGAGLTAPLDIDGAVLSATDGTLILRHLFGFSGDRRIPFRRSLVSLSCLPGTPP